MRYHRELNPHAWPFVQWRCLLLRSVSSLCCNGARHALLDMCRPDPQWHIVVDSWLNIPYPDWYLEYFRTHFDAMKNPHLFLGAFAAALADTGAVGHLSCDLAEPAPMTFVWACMNAAAETSRTMLSPRMPCSNWKAVFHPNDPAVLF